MKTYHIRQTQLLPLNIPEAWSFFSNPNNLGEITPAHMKFRILENTSPIGMREGQLIRYRIRIMPGIWLNWLTQITHVRHQESFIDEQLTGPYALWHHRHHFRKVDGGVEVTDEVTYALPFGWLGRWVHVIFVRRELNSIFAHRRNVLHRRFNKDTTQTSLSV